MKYLVAILLSICISAPSFAEKMAYPNKCMKENITINIRYNLKGSSFSEVKKKFDAQNAKIEEYAKAKKLVKFELKNRNYNINSSASSYNQAGVPENFNYSGNGRVSYTLDNADAAFKFSEFLISQKIQVSMNSNTRKQGNCNLDSMQIIKSH